jgi:hypothetical protein
MYDTMETMNNDLWETIGMNGKVLFILKRIVKNINIEYIAVKKIQHYWRKNHVKREFYFGDRVMVYNKGLLKIRYATVIDVQDCDYITLKYQTSRKHLLFYDPRLESCVNPHIIKKLCSWKY